MSMTGRLSAPRRVAAVASLLGCRPRALHATELIKTARRRETTNKQTNSHRETARRFTVRNVNSVFRQFSHFLR